MRAWTRHLYQAWRTGEAGTNFRLVGREPLLFRPTAGEEISAEQEAKHTQLLLPAWKHHGARHSPCLTVMLQRCDK